MILTAENIYDRHQEKLDLKWVAGRGGQDRPLQIADVRAAKDSPFGAWVGHLNLIHPNRIQVLGVAEMHYLNGLRKNSHADALKQLFESSPAVVVIADGEPVTGDLRQFAEDSGTPLFSSALAAHKIINHLQYYLSNFLADKEIVHGVFMEVLGIGVLLTGKSGLGKSELALELISRNHRLVADDAPEFRRVAPDTLNGTCPPALSGFLEVRGLGVLNIRAMFGDSAIKLNKNLRLIIHLQGMNEKAVTGIDRLYGSRQTRTLLEVEVAQVILPVAPGHNLAVLAEGAVRNHILLLKGYDAAQAFIERQQRLITEAGP